ncbi:hypothetical protein V6N13_027248 [Hibiscus sabdariffa]|uniref:Uncharacterized protein n=2 Tax=Hibiscus sabdariffa TaxID=183260 RepID=A0ABR2B3Z0_9ROSI
MVADSRLPLQSGNKANIIFQNLPKEEPIRTHLLRPNTIKQHAQNDEMIHREIKCVPGLYKILVNAADNKQRDPSMDSGKLVIVCGAELDLRLQQRRCDSHRDSSGGKGLCLGVDLWPFVD